MRTKPVKCDATTLLVKNASSLENLTPETRNRIQVSGHGKHDHVGFLCQNQINAGYNPALHAQSNQARESPCLRPHGGQPTVE